MSNKHQPETGIDVPSRAFFCGSHIVGAAIFGALAICGLFWLGIVTKTPNASFVAVISAASAYMSQLIAVNGIWIQSDRIYRIVWPFIVLAIVLWLYGMVVIII